MVGRVHDFQIFDNFVKAYVVTFIGFFVVFSPCTRSAFSTMYRLRSRGRAASAATSVVNGARCLLQTPHFAGAPCRGGLDYRFNIDC
jgi:hypothetical protein